MCKWVTPEKREVKLEWAASIHTDGSVLTKPVPAVRVAVKTAILSIICPFTLNGAFLCVNDVVHVPCLNWDGTYVFFREVNTNKYIINTALTSSYTWLENTRLAQITAKAIQVTFESPLAGSPVLTPKFVARNLPFNCEQLLWRRIAHLFPLGGFSLVNLNFSCSPGMHGWAWHHDDKRIIIIAWTLTTYVWI